MKKITTLMVMLMGCVFSALAQTVASTPTDPSKITEGYYVLKVKPRSSSTSVCAKANTYDSSDRGMVGESLLSAADYARIYYVMPNGSKLRIKTAFTNNWWESASGTGDSYRPQQFSVGSSPADFDVQKDGEWTYLKTTTRKTFSGSKTVYVTCNSKNCLGYWDNSNPADNTAQFQFYAVDVPTPKLVVSTTSAPVWFFIASQGESTKILSAEKQNNYDAIPSSRGYVNTIDESSKISVNDIEKQLWCVTQNSNGSYNLYNGYVGQSLNKYSTAQTDPYFCTAYSAGIFNGVTGCDILPLADGSFVFKAYNEPYDRTWSLSGTSLKNSDADNAVSFLFKEPTFTFPMYSGNDDNIYNTFAAPFAVALADDENAVKMYKGTVNTAEKELVLSEVSAVPANAGVMLMGENSQNQNVTFKVIADAEAPAALEGNELVGTTVELAAADLADKLILGISDETHEVGFFSINDNVATLTANHAYLNKTNSAVQTLSVRLAGQPTGIGQISMDTNKVNTQAPVYDLTGRRVNHTVKGQLYIQNGRKFMAQ